MRLANHAYGQLSGPVPIGRMISMRDNGVRWARIAASRPGSSIYADIVRWAETLKARRSVVLFAYHHEPEASGSDGYNWFNWSPGRGNWVSLASVERATLRFAFDATARSSASERRPRRPRRQSGRQAVDMPGAAGIACGPRREDGAA